MNTEIRSLARSTMVALAIVAAVFLSASVISAQQKLEPVPVNLIVVEQPDSPVQITIDGLYPSPGNFKTFGYTVRNTTTKAIRSIGMLNNRDGTILPFCLGLPGTQADQLGYQSGLEGGASKTLSYLFSGPDGKSNPATLSVDFVLFWDEKTWGPDSAGEGERLIGIFDGHKRFLSDVKKLVANKDDVGLRALIMRDGPPTEQIGIENRTKRQIGVGTGYSVARLSFRSDLLGRGDLTGVPARIRDIELDLGLVPFRDDKRKQVTVQYGFNAPIRLTGFSFGSRELLFDERFSAEGDWLTGLQVKIRNDSGRTIRFVSLGISFPETRRTGLVMASNMRYGPHPVTQAENGNQPLVAPGQSFDIEVNGGLPGGLKRFLQTRQSFDTISRAFIDISYIEFEDGTRWSGGQYMKLDPENPRRWIPMNSPDRPRM